MGCDIHIWIEKRVNGAWIPAETYSEEGDDPHYQSDIYQGRNYRLFSVLADVRNYDGVKPIAAPRGIPEDASPIVAELVRGYGDHSYSWFTLRELLDFNWMQPHRHATQVSGDEYVRWSGWDKANGVHPKTAFRSRGGPGIVTITMGEADEMLAGIDAYDFAARAAKGAEMERFNVEVEWFAPIVRECGDFFNETIPALIQMAGGSRNADDLRIVFGFDS